MPIPPRCFDVPLLSETKLIKWSNPSDCNMQCIMMAVSHQGTSSIRVGDSRLSYLASRVVEERGIARNWIGRAM